MTFFADLSPCSYFGIEFAENLRAVGWLSQNELYTQGNVSEALFEQLCKLLQNPWNPMYFCGIHECDFCRFSEGFGGGSRFKKYEIKHQSYANLFIPGEGFIYVVPESITHYIDAHNYCPPEEFCRAVMQCPEMRSGDYAKAMLRNGGKDLRRKAELKFKVKQQRRLRRQSDNLKNIR